MSVHSSRYSMLFPRLYTPVNAGHVCGTVIALATHFVHVDIRLLKVGQKRVGQRLAGGRLTFSEPYGIFPLISPIVVPETHSHLFHGTGISGLVSHKPKAGGAIAV